MENGKVTIIGAGFVGSTTAFSLMQSSVVSEIVLIDINKDKAEGDILDMSHGVPFLKPVKMTAGDYKDAAGSEVVVITAGANQKPDETRLDLLKKNTSIFKSIITELKKYIDSNTVILVVTNPVDILTYYTYKISGFPKNMVIGSGTVLDTARFRYSIAEQTNVDARNVHAYILGEHGDSEFAVWSGTTIGMMPLEEYCSECDKIDKDAIYSDVKNAAYKIIEKKGATYYAVALAVKRIVECILRDENSILTVTSCLDGEYGLEDLCISVPTVVGAKGAKRVVEINLSASEFKQLRDSAAVLKKHYNEIMNDENEE